jgi:hypothetical protein
MKINFTHDSTSYHIDSWELPVNTPITYQVGGASFPIGEPIWFDRQIINHQPEDRLQAFGHPTGDPIWFDKGQGLTPDEYANFKIFCETLGVDFVLI